MNPQGCSALVVAFQSIKEDIKEDCGLWVGLLLGILDLNGEIIDLHVKGKNLRSRSQRACNPSSLSVPT